MSKVKKKRRRKEPYKRHADVRLITHKLKYYIEPEYIRSNMDYIYLFIYKEINV